MKKSVILLAILLTLVSFSAAAVQDTLVLNGSVGQTVTLTVTEGTTSGYDLSADLATTEVATLDYSGNVPFTLTAVSANAANSVSTGFAFAGDQTTPEYLDYTLYRNGSTWANIDTTGPDSGSAVPIQISYTGDPLLATGSYTDTITFEILAK